MYNIIIEWVIANRIEVFASIMGVVGVWLTTRQHILCWPIGLINVSLSMFVFFQAKLYYDFILQIFYFGLTLYGWYNWLYGGNNSNDLPVQKIKHKVLIHNTVLIALMVVVLGYLAQKYTDASLPYLDAFTSAGGIVVTFWMAKKILENWLAWIVIDLTCVGMYIYKELYAFSVLYFIFTILAIIGYYSWKKSFQANLLKLQ